MSVVPGIVTRNWRLKIAAFGLAVFLWAVVSSRAGERTGQEVSAPVVAQVGDLDWMLGSEPSPPTVQVRFSGPLDEILQLANRRVSVRIPVDTVHGRDTTVQLRRDWVQVEGQGGLVVDDIVPASVRLTFEETESKLLPLAVRVDGDLADELALAAPVGLNPQMVRVRGPARSVRSLDSIPLLPLDLSAVDASGIYRVEVDTSGLSALSVSPTSATLGLRIEEAVERTFGGVPVQVELPDGSDADSLAVEPRTMQVTLRGARTPVAGIDADGVVAVVGSQAVRDMEPGESRRVPVRIRGVPELVRAFAAVDSVTVSRPAAAEGAAADPPGGPDR